MKISFWSVSFALLVLCLNVAAAAGVAPPTGDYVEGDVLVTFKPGYDLPAVHQTLTLHSLTSVTDFTGLSDHYGKQFCLVHDNLRSTAQLIAELSLDPAVESVEPNYLRRVTSVPNDPLFTNLWGLRDTGQSVNGFAGTANADIHFLPAWALARTSTNPVVVAVIDTGVDYTHPDLAGNMWFNPGEIPDNGLDDDNDGYVDDEFGYDFIDHQSSPQDSGFHGTHVAGTVAAVGNNELGVIGVDYQAKIMALKASSDGDTLSTSAIIEAIQYAIMMKNRGVNIAAINESFGGGGYSSTEVAAMQAAGAVGIIFCISAGNDGLDHDTNPAYPADYALTNKLVVAATDQDDALAGFSDYGANTVDLGAPGVNIMSALPVSQAGTLAYVQEGTTTYSAQELMYSGTTTGITDKVYACGLGNPADFPAAVSNHIALIQRGTLFFSEKVSNAIAAGARGAIIYNNVSGNFNGTLQSSSNWIPAISLSQTDGQSLLALLPTTVTLVNRRDPTQVYQYLNGTSMAAPHVAGAVAFAAMNFPGETVAQRIQRVLNNVDVVPGLQGKVRTGGRLNLQRIVDSDLNGLPDWWEQEYFGQLTGTDSSADPDDDGLSNRTEWLAGTNPTNAASVLRLAVLPVTNVNSVSLTWPSVAGKTYRLERATNLLTGFDSVLGTNLTATTPINTMTDSEVLPGDARYYRVGVEP